MVKRGTGRKHWEKRRMGRKIIMKTGGKIASWWKTKAVTGAAICRSVEGMEVRWHWGQGKGIRHWRMQWEPTWTWSFNKAAIYSVHHFWTKANLSLLCDSKAASSCSNTQLSSGAHSSPAVAAPCQQHSVCSMLGDPAITNKWKGAQLSSHLKDESKANCGIQLWAPLVSQCCQDAPGSLAPHTDGSDGRSEVGTSKLTFMKTVMQTESRGNSSCPHLLFSSLCTVPE